MKIDVHFTPLGLVAGDLAGRGVVVVDALRATTTIVTALANGAKAVIPAATSEEAVRLASNLEKDGVVLAGERRSVKIEGFGLGNSPREMTAAAVAGKTIVRSEEHTSELQSLAYLVCRLLLEKKKNEA